MTVRSTFFAAVGLRLEYIPDPTVCTATVNGRYLRYNPAWFEALPFNHAVGVLAQKSFQCAACHHIRMIGRDPLIANLASAHVANHEIKEAGFELPVGHVFDERFKGMSFERVCNILEREREETPPPPPFPNPNQGDAGSKSAGGNQPDPGQPNPQGQEPPQNAQGTTQDGADDDQSDNPRDDQGDQQGAPGGSAGQSGGNPLDQLDIGNCGSIQQPRTDEGKLMDWVELSREKSGWENAASKAEMATRAGSEPGGADLLSHAKQDSRLPWVEHTRRFLRSSLSRNYSWTRPDRRYLPDAYIPSLHSQRMKHLIIGSDTSKSVMTERQIRIITDEVNGLLLEVRPLKTTVIACDAQVQRVDDYTPNDFPIELHFKGQGGTRVTPVFDWIDDEGIRPTCLIYFTDLEIWEGEFPEEPPYPVLWASTNRSEVPWGEVVMLDEI